MHKQIELTDGCYREWSSILSTNHLPTVGGIVQAFCIIRTNSMVILPFALTFLHFFYLSRARACIVDHISEKVCRSRKTSDMETLGSQTQPNNHCLSQLLHVPFLSFSVFGVFFFHPEQAEKKKDLRKFCIFSHLSRISEVEKGS